MFSIERLESRLFLERHLRHAIWINDSAKAKEVLASGANVNATDLLGTTPLMFAAMLSTCHRNTEILNMLLHAGGDIYQKDFEGESTLDHLRKDNYGAFTAVQQATRSELADYLEDETRRHSKK